MTPHSYDPHYRDHPSVSHYVDKEGPNQDSLMILWIGICGWMAPSFLPVDPLESDHCAYGGHQILSAYLIITLQTTPKLGGLTLQPLSYISQFCGSGIRRGPDMVILLLPAV